MFLVITLGLDNKQWCVYILKCGDGSLYTGITNDLPNRLRMHRNGRGAKYTKGRGPLSLHYMQPCDSKSDALRRELEIKSFSTIKKRELLSNHPLPE